MTGCKALGCFLLRLNLNEVVTFLFMTVVICVVSILFIKSNNSSIYSSAFQGTAMLALWQKSNEMLVSKMRRVLKKNVDRLSAFKETRNVLPANNLRWNLISHMEKKRFASTWFLKERRGKCLKSCAGLDESVAR